MSRNAWGFSFLLEGVSEGVCLRTERGEGSEGGFERRAGASLSRFINRSSVKGLWSLPYQPLTKALSVELLVREPRLRTAKRSGSSVPRELESYH